MGAPKTLRRISRCPAVERREKGLWEVAVEMTRRGKRGKVPPTATRGGEGRPGLSTLPTALGNRAQNQGARFPHSHSDGGGSSSTSDLPSPQRAGRESSRHRLLENQRALKEVLHVGSTEDLLFQSFLHRSPQNLRAVALQDLVQPIHFPHPLPGPPMDDLGEIAESRLPQIQQLLPLQITLPPLS